ncbi:DUF6716 putative glycosyltransferase [Microcella humidisoli]|uniref:Glycosyltransferase n=1 Tax=Microcella humidisoli TaxID=2963406 RepID=A0ABY5FY34_9MICO|nr:DUF6716 putative glycosyltransferase [Microcella humidisoli]UTT63037.1 hypothetical protein NNL39_02700 [Microcella humidisoli]
MIVVALTDSDSYLKWGAATLDRVVPEAERHVIVVANPVMPSVAQRDAAVASTSWRGGEVAVMQADDAVAFVRAIEADAVLVAMRGPMAALLLAMLAELPRRPVLWSGIPGIALPARRKALVYRAQADLIVVHSHRERRAFAELDRDAGLAHRFALTTLPFLDRRPAHGDDVVLAAQALVPVSRAARTTLVARFAEAARRHPERRFVLKVRARAGERQTHDERWPLDAVLHRIGETPANLVVQTGSMSAALDRAGGLVTVSSTAILEAIARGIPALAINDDGVDDALLNTTFIGSGLLGSTDDLVAGRFREPDAAWAADNYLHDPADDDAAQHLDELQRLRLQGALPARVPARSTRGGVLRRAWDRRTALGRHDGDPLGLVALVVGTPVRAVVRAGSRLRARAATVGAR